MSLRIIKNTPPIKEEIVAEEAEARKTTADGELVIILANKKKVLLDIEKINDDIKVGKETIDKKNIEIDSLNNKIIEVQSLLRDNQQELNEFNESKVIEKDKIIEEIKGKNIEKDKLSSEILDIFNKNELEKFNNSKDIKVLELKKDSLKQEIEKLDNKNKENIKYLDIYNKDIDVLLSNIEIKKQKELELNNKLTSLNNSIEDQEKIKKNNLLSISQQETKIDENKNSITELEKEIESNKTLNESEKSIHISLLSKQRTLEQKTAFIKSQYESAGIKWEE